jgi:hypothetical protein
MSVLLRILRNRPFRAVMGLISIWTGLGMLGIVAGFSNTGHWPGNIVGLAFIMNGCVFLAQAFRPKADPAD